MPTKMPAPRLQLRWEAYTGESDIGAQWACNYELVLPLDKYDIRREVWKDGELVGEIGELVIPIKTPQLRAAEREPCRLTDGSFYYDTPYRDGVHAQWDAKLLGDLPIYAVAIDGQFGKYEREEVA